MAAAVVPTPNKYKTSGSKLSHTPAGVAIPTVRHFSERVANNGQRLIRINPADATIPLGNGVSLAMGGLAGINVINAVLSQ